MGTPGVIRAAYPGDVFSFSEGATKAYYARPHVKTGKIRPYKLVPSQIFGTTVDRFNHGEVDEIIVPIRNNNSRSVEAMQKLLRYVHGWVAGEQYYLVEQCCLVNPDVGIDQVTNLWTMDPAAAQVKLFKEGRKLYYFSKPDTAMAAQELKKTKRRDVCAIASHEIGAHLSLKNLGNVCDHRYNFTHFLHIVKKDNNNVENFMPDIRMENACITKIILYGEFFPEAGITPSDVFARHRVKVTNPIDAGENTFEHTTTILDLRGHLKSQGIVEAFKELKKMTYHDADEDREKFYTIDVMGCFVGAPPPKRHEVIYKTPVLNWTPRPR